MTPRFMVISAPLYREFKDGAIYYVRDTHAGREVATFTTESEAITDARWRNEATDDQPQPAPTHGGR